MADLPPMFDTHLHLIQRDRFSYAWTQGVASLQDRAFTYESYAQLAAAKCVTAALFMESGVDDRHAQAETRFACALARRPGSLVRGVIANCRPESADMRRDVESSTDAKIVGFRRILHVMPNDTALQPTFVENVRWLGGAGYTFDLCFLERQLPSAIALARQCVETRLILDHCGIPDIAGGADDSWRGAIDQLAALPNVHCKMSGLPTYCPPGGASAAAMRPYVSHCVERFGADRLVWGSDWPVVEINSTASSWIDTTRELLAELSLSEQRKIVFQNAISIYAVGDD